MDVYQSRVEEWIATPLNLMEVTRIDHAVFFFTNGDGIEMASNSELDVQNSLIGYNGSNGITTGGAVNVNYANISAMDHAPSMPRISQRWTTASFGSTGPFRN